MLAMYCHIFISWFCKLEHRDGAQFLKFLLVQKWIVLLPLPARHAPPDTPFTIPISIFISKAQKF